MAGGKGGRHLREIPKKRVEKEELVETFKDLNFSDLRFLSAAPKKSDPKTIIAHFYYYLLNQKLPNRLIHTDQSSHIS